MATATLEYGYGHTKEAATLVRKALNEGLTGPKKIYSLKISVTKANSGYGGPRVHITSPEIRLDKQYRYIIDKDGNASDSGTLVVKPCSEFPNGRPVYSAELVIPDELKALNDRINTILYRFGKDKDDAMTDYFNNTTPLFYGVEYKA